MQRLTPVCSCARIRSKVLHGKLSVINQASSNDIVYSNFKTHHVGQLSSFSTTSQCSRTTEAGTADQFSPTNSTTEKPAQEKKAPKKGKLIRRKPTATHTNQKVCTCEKILFRWRKFFYIFTTSRQFISQQLKYRGCDLLGNSCNIINVLPKSCNSC